MATTGQPNATASDTPNPAVQAGGGSGGPDTFAKLHHMSATAGVGLHDYVAVSTPAVVAVVAGMAGVTAFLSTVLLVVPLFAVVCGIIALVQIQKSNGTQTGRSIAVIGLLAGLVICGMIGWREYSRNRAFEESKEEIGNIFSAFANDTAAGEYKSAYSRFSPTFQQRYPYEDFEGFFHLAEPNVGRMNALVWNKLLEAADSNEQEGAQMARAVVQIGFAKSPQQINSNVVLLRRPGPDGKMGQWMVEAMNPPFEKPPSKKDPTPQQGGGGGASQQPR